MMNLNKIKPDYIPKQICYNCGEKYGKDNGLVANAMMNQKCELCDTLGITMTGAKFAPYNFKQEGNEDANKK